MKRMTMIAGVAVAVCAASVEAEYIGVSCEVTQWTGPEGEGQLYDVVRLYANFDDPENGVNFWGGSGPTNPLIITNTSTNNPDGPSGSGFFEADFAQGSLPQPGNLLYKNFQEEFDNSTYLTIGVKAGYEQFDPNDDDAEDVGPLFQLTPGFNPALGGTTSIEIDDGGVVTTVGAPNSLAGEDGRVLLGQFTIVQGEWVYVEGVIQWFGSAGTGGGVESFSLWPITCSSPCPVANLNDDFVVDTLDLLALLKQWGTCESCDADLDDDGVVGVLDLIELLDSWGPCEFLE